MKKRRLKPFVKISALGVILFVCLLSVSLLTNNKTKQAMKDDNSFTYVNDYIFDNYYPVINEDEKMTRPYNSENVSLYKNFYDKDASEEEQKNSIIYYEGIYMQNSGVDYKSDEPFDVVASVSGTVTNITEDTLLGKTVEIKNSNEITTMYQSLGEVIVKKGDTVTQGQVIAKSGTCNLNNDIKQGLHFEIYKNGTVINPEKSYDKNLKDIINSNLVDGVILLRVSEDDKNTTYLRSIDFPFVVVGRPDNPEEVLWVNNDNISAMYNVVEKLIKKGHRKIGFVGAIENLNMSKDRFIGYKNALFDNKISYDESIVVHKDEFIENEGQSACNELLQNKDITAIVTTDDLIAFGIMKELKLKNIDNISIVGFNNTPLSAYQNPPLATVDINSYELGYSAAKLLINNLEGKEHAKRHYIVDTEFIERESFI